MKLKVEVMSKEIIKPSSPTPDALCHYQLSFLDQISPPVYNPLILFYPMTKCNIQVNKIKLIDHLKQSMSNALTYFYPLAGRINHNLFVDCNDEGVPFLEAQVPCQLSDVVENAVPSELNKLLPSVLDDAEELPLGIQLNIFECGGIGIGVCISHKIADALSLFTYVNTWAAISRGDQSFIVSPELISAKLFPPKNILGYEPRIGISTERIVTKRFVFSASKIQEIKAKCTNSSTATTGNQKGPSRIEALSAFIWSRFVASTKAKSIPDSCFYAIVHAVNLRTRLDPPLPEHSFGNFYQMAMTVPSRNSGEDFYNLVNQIRESIRKLDSKYVRQLQDGQSHFDFIKERAESFITGQMVSFNFTSLCRFPRYKADFGWGKPIWVGSVSLTFKNLVVFMDTAFGDGIEAWISLQEEDMATFGSDEMLLAYAVSHQGC
ncbi:vinorine synthase-like [Durio zibethinus]|uniref:Vinorine synthase-like n=1 Tax=Durio zibethinus TaxID=66656 RepID=A0A6P6BEU5_DURZI|nr:vinorine synthase-like [Durio zibethinus]